MIQIHDLIHQGLLHVYSYFLLPQISDPELPCSPAFLLLLPFPFPGLRMFSSCAGTKRNTTQIIEQYDQTAELEFGYVRISYATVQLEN